jgi:hypothetical protein
MKTQSFTTQSLLKKSLWAAVIMACAIMPATISAQTCNGGTGISKVLNGGFQTGSGYNITDWTVAWNSSADPEVFIGGNGHGGSSQSLNMGSLPGENRVSQVIRGLTAGQRYILCFYLSNGASGPLTPSSFEASWNDKNMLQLINSGPFDYEYFSFQVEAVGGGNDVLSFEERNSPSFWYLDGVAVQVCPACSNFFSPADGAATKPLPNNSE